MLSQRWLSQVALGAICFGALFTQVSALTVEYCSSLNTATTARNSSIYQSNGLCHDFCVSDYAFAILQNDGCWCSDYAPASTTTGCNNNCPGYPSDKCGGSGVYGYIALTIAPLGTEGASSTTASSTSAPSTSAVQQVTVTATPEAVTVVQTATLVPTETSSSSSSSDAATTPTSPTTMTSSATTSSSTWTPTPVTSLETVTGQVRTVTITPTSPPTTATAISSAGISQDGKKSGGISTGGAVGITIGAVGAVAIVAGMFWFLARRRRDKENSVSRRGSTRGLASAGGLNPSRTMSQSSRFVLNTDGHQVVSTWEDGDVEPGPRSSRLMPIDPRLNPFSAVYQRGENKSRESINTIRDDHDYSRRVAGQTPILRATNPD